MEDLSITSTIKNYFDMAWRRRFWVIIPFFVVILAGLSYALMAPRIYEAKTVILVVPQKVPQEFVKSILPIGLEERLKTIYQQVMSRTNLEAIIKEYKVYVDSNAFLESKVGRLKKQIKINVASNREVGDAFEVAFRDKDPRVARDVTSALASNFISDNLNMRESRAVGTSNFIADELESVKKRLEEKEEQLKEYRRRFMGAMPEQLADKPHRTDETSVPAGTAEP